MKNILLHKKIFLHIHTHIMVTTIVDTRNKGNISGATPVDQIDLHQTVTTNDKQWDEKERQHIVCVSTHQYDEIKNFRYKLG